MNLLLSERWDAAKTLPQIPAATPMLFLSGKQDELVPQAQMKQLHKLRGTGSSRWREFNGTHNDTYLNPEYWAEIDKWLAEEIEHKVKAD